VLGAEPLGDVEALHVGEHDVEDDEIGLEGAHRRDGARARAGGLDGEALETEGHGHDVHDVRLVVDHEDAMGVDGGGHARSIGTEAVRFLRRA